MRTQRRLAAAAALTAGVLAAAASAQASSIVYVGSDGNVHLATADGSRTARVTSDGGSRSYRSPTQADDGTIVVGGQREIHVLNRDGTPRSGPWPTYDSASDPSSVHVQPAGGLVAYHHLYDPAFGAPYYLTQFMTTGGPGGDCTEPYSCSGGHGEPRWVPGTDSVFAIMIPQRWTVEVVPTSGAGEDWLHIGTDSGMEIQSVDMTRTGDNRILLQISHTDGSPASLHLWQNEGRPPNPGGGEVCNVELGSDVSNPRWSPDASMITWHDHQGVWVSPAPTGSGTCAVAPRLIAPGGSEPDWGTAGVPVVPSNQTTTTQQTQTHQTKKPAAKKKGKKKPGKCSQLKGKKRKRCVKKSCATLQRKAIKAQRRAKRLGTRKARRAAQRAKLKHRACKRRVVRKG